MVHYKQLREKKPPYVLEIIKLHQSTFLHITEIKSNPDRIFYDHQIYIGPSYKTVDIMDQERPLTFNNLFRLSGSENLHILSPNKAKKKIVKLLLKQVVEIK